MYYRGVARAEGLRVQTYTKLLDASHNGDHIECEIETRHGRGTIQCNRLILATGYYDQPNCLDVPGEELPHVHHYYDEAHLSYGLDVVVIGGKNSAVEAALELFRAGARTTIVSRNEEFTGSVKYWMKPDIENRIKAGEITACMGTEVQRIEPDRVIVRHQDGREAALRADRIYALIGFRPDTDLFKRIGIEIHPESGRPTLNPDTFETNVPGVYMAGSITAGFKTSNIFIENGRFDGEKIFGDES